MSCHPFAARIGLSLVPGAPAVPWRGASMGLLDSMGMYAEPIAQPAGQVADRACSLGDGTRLHAHVMPDGTVRVHRDEHDPRAGMTSLVKHVLLETTGGQLLLGAGLGALAARVWEALTA